MLVFWVDVHGECDVHLWFKLCAGSGVNRMHVVCLG